jgi:site-specific DNA recombinase
MLVCRDCGYALYRTSTPTSARKLYCYRCLGADAYRHLRGALCANRPVRADYLDEFVWREIIRLLEEPALVQTEIGRRLAEAQIADPLRQREQGLRNQQVRLRNVIERLLTAYQEELLSLEQLRQRMPALRKQQQAVNAELQSLALTAADRSRYLRLTETLAEFCLPPACSQCSLRSSEALRGRVNLTCSTQQSVRQEMIFEMLQLEAVRR